MTTQNKEKLSTTVDEELTEMLFKSAGLSNSLQFIIAATAFMILKDVVEQNHLIVWIATLVIITLGRTIFVSLYWERRRHCKPVGYCLNAYLLLLYLNAATWGMLIYIPMTTVKIGILSFISFVVAGLSAGALTSLSALLRAAIPYLLLVLLPVLIFFVMREEARYIAMAAIVGLYIFLLIYTSININKMLRNALKIDSENDILYSFLKQSKARLDRKITYYKTAIESLENKIRLRNNYFEHTTIALCIIDNEATIIETNAAFIKYIGINLATDLPVSLFMCIHSDDRHAFQNALSHVNKDHIHTREQYRVKTGKGIYEPCYILMEYVDGFINVTILRI